MTPTLFDQETLGHVRPTDPDTSHAAAHGERSELKRRVRAVLERNPQGLTDFELAAWLFPDPVVAARRKPTVAKRRLDVGAVDTGVRRMSPENREAIVWRLP